MLENQLIPRELFFFVRISDFTSMTTLFHEYASSITANYLLQ